MMSDCDFLHAVKDGELVIDPFDESQLQPCSYDMTLGTQFALFTPPMTIDPRQDLTRHYKKEEATRYLISPQMLVLANTAERIELSTGMAARVDGKSSLARLGLSVHITAGFIDAGFHGTVTLELVNMTYSPIVLRAGMPIAQLSVFRLERVASHGYNGKYQDQIKPTPTKYHENFK